MIIKMIYGETPPHAKNFNEPIGNWDVSNVEIMSDMFEEADNFNQPLNNWNTSKVKDMEAMFFRAKKIQSTFR